MKYMPNNSTLVKLVNKYTQKWVAEYIYMDFFPHERT